jgi:hypothetical protein
MLRKVPAEHARYIHKRAAPADQAGIMRAVTDNLALGTQDGIFQRNRIEKSRTFHLRPLHHRTSRKVYFLNSILPTHHLTASNLVDARVSIRSLHSFFVFAMV